MLIPSFAGWGSKHDIRVVETNYDEYALVATRISKSTGTSTMVLLYSMSLPAPMPAPLCFGTWGPQSILVGICPTGGGSRTAHGTAG